jgi:hypothetical protein
MSNWRDNLKNAQSAGSKIPRLDIVKTLSMSETDGKEIAFSYWDKEAEENKYIKTPITGVFIGKALRCSVFDDNYGKKGAYYSSALYLSNSRIAMFSPSKDLFVGSKDDVEKWLIEKGVGDSLKVKMCLLIATKSGLIEVRTNTSIAIDQFNAFGQDVFLDNKVILTPSLYVESDPMISKKAKNYLGKFASKNPPKYASISIGDKITDDDVVAYNVDKHAEDYILWKEFIQKGNVVETNMSEPTEHNYSPPSKENTEALYPNQTSFNQHVSKTAARSNDDLANVEDVTNDLPF